MRIKRILVDHRENAETLIAALKQQYGFSVESSTLKLGDYFITPDTVIERKTTRDFIVSIIDNRLFNQAFKLSRLAERPIIVVEGKSFLHSGMDFSLEAVKGALITLAHTFYIPVLRTIDENDTAWYMNQLYEHVQRIGKCKGCRAGYKGKKIKTQKLQVLKSLPGIGNETAKDLLNHFGSVADIITASEKDLQEVAGIGKITAKKIKNVVEEELEKYLISADLTD